MILVNSPGSWDDLYWPLEHAQWHGWTPTDLIFPFFLFIVGTSLAYALRRVRADRAGEGGPVPWAVYGRIVRRTVVLILLGLLLNFSWSLCSYLLGGGQSPTLTTLRLPGVLQRIAVVYLVTSLVVLHLGVRGQTVLVAALLLGYWALLAWLPNPHDYRANLSPAGNVVRVVDRAVFGEAHMYTQAQRTDRSRGTSQHLAGHRDGVVGLLVRPDDTNVGPQRADRRLVVCRRLARHGDRNRLEHRVAH